MDQPSQHTHPLATESPGSALAKGHSACTLLPLASGSGDLCVCVCLCVYVCVCMCVQARVWEVGKTSTNFWTLDIKYTNKPKTSCLTDGLGCHEGPLFGPRARRVNLDEDKMKDLAPGGQGS